MIKNMKKLKSFKEKISAFITCGKVKPFWKGFTFSKVLK